MAFAAEYYLVAPLTCVSGSKLVFDLSPPLPLDPTFEHPGHLGLTSSLGARYAVPHFSRTRRSRAFPYIQGCNTLGFCSRFPQV